MAGTTLLAAKIRKCFGRAAAGIGLASGLCGRATRDLWMDGGFTHAAAISYYFIVSIFPMLLVLIGAAGFFLEPEELQNAVLGWLGQYFPAGTRTVFRDNIDAIIASRGSMSVLGSAVLVWSCTLMFDAINQAVNAAWGMRGNARFFSDKLKSLLLVGVIVVAALFSTYLTTRTALLGRFQSLLETFPMLERSLVFGREATGVLIPFCLSVAAFGLAFRLLPRLRISVRDVWPAALATAVLWEVSKRVFVWYLTDHAEYRQIYGTISAVLVLLIWAYVSSLILAWGAGLTSEIWKMRRKGDAGDKDEFPNVGAL